MKKANVIVLAGQSNAVGVGHVKYLSKHFDAQTEAALRRGYENVKINYVSHDIASGGFVNTTVNCTERTKDTLGPELGIAKSLTQRYPGEEFFIVKCAVGGSNLHNDWRSPASGVPYEEARVAEPEKALESKEFRFPGWCYNALVKLLGESLGTLEKEGYSPEIIAFCWMQGESDPDKNGATEAYIGRYDGLLRDIRGAFPAYFEKCTYIEAGISEMWEQYQKLNAYKKAYAEEKGHIYLDTVGAGLTTRYEPEEEPDVAHYDCGSTVRLGELFAEHICPKG